MDSSLRSDAESDVVEHRGFPNPATDTNIVPLDLNKLLIKHPPSTFCMRIDTDTWEYYGVFKDDIVLIDKSLNPKPTDLVIWWDETTFVLSKFHALPTGTIVWGVVLSIIHRYRS